MIRAHLFSSDMPIYSHSPTGSEVDLTLKVLSKCKMSGKRVEGVKQRTTYCGKW